MSKKPICNVNHSYTGNVHLPHTQADDFSVWLTSQAEKSFVVTEVGSDNKQHLHYFCENLDIQAETFKKNLRTKYPELKKTGKGGGQQICFKFNQRRITILLSIQRIRKRNL